MDESDWRKILEFWGQYSIEEPDSRFLKIPLSEFYAKRYWFTVNWLSFGNHVDTDETVSLAIERMKATEKIFVNLAGRTYLNPSPALLAEIQSLGMKRALTEAQLRNIASTLESPSGANFSVPGAGKTATTLVLIRLLISRGVIDRAVVVCPKSAFEAWLDEPGKVFEDGLSTQVFDGPIIDRKTQILIVNFEKAEASNKRSLIKQWLSQGSGLLVIDEAHRIKRGSSGKRWLACMDLSSVSKRVELLTGTPMPQSYADLRNLFSISWKVVPKGQFTDTRLSNLEPGGLFVRTTKSQLNLPKANFVSVPIAMGKLQSEIYHAITKSYQGLFSVNENDIATLRKKGRAIMTVLAAATNPALIRKDSKEELLKELRWPPLELASNPELITALNSYMSHEVPTKYEWVSKFVANSASAGRKVLVWSSFVGNLELLKKTLKPFNPAVIHGSVERVDREEELKRFRFDPACSVLLTNPQTLGEGISLHETAHDAIFVDRTYNAAQYLQALDRIHRLGLRDDVETNFYLLQAEGTIDKRVEVRLAAKIEALGNMLNDEGLKAISLGDSDDDLDLLSSLGLDQIDVADLFKHLGSSSD
jgi:SNF2 family DNA or RNA helicase